MMDLIDCPVSGTPCVPVAMNVKEICDLRSELAALKAENESLKKDAELWRSYQKRKQDLLDRGFLGRYSLF